MAQFLIVGKDRRNQVAINLDFVQRIEFVEKDGAQKAYFYAGTTDEKPWPYNGLDEVEHVRNAIGG